jgi:hypothetical protein
MVTIEPSMMLVATASVLDTSGRSVAITDPSERIEVSADGATVRGSVGSAGRFVGSGSNSVGSRPPVRDVTTPRIDVPSTMVDPIAMTEPSVGRSVAIMEPSEVIVVKPAVSSGIV